MGTPRKPRRRPNLAGLNALDGTRVYGTGEVVTLLGRSQNWVQGKCRNVLAPLRLAANRGGWEVTADGVRLLAGPLLSLRLSAGPTESEATAQRRAKAAFDRGRAACRVKR